MNTVGASAKTDITEPESHHLNAHNIIVSTYFVMSYQQCCRFLLINLKRYALAGGIYNSLNCRPCLACEFQPTDVNNRWTTTSSATGPAERPNDRRNIQRQYVQILSFTKCNDIDLHKLMQMQNIMYQLMQNKLNRDFCRIY